MTEDDMIQIFIKRAIKGMAYLDEFYSGWIDKINLSIFDMASAKRCIIGQLLGDYWAHCSSDGSFWIYVPRWHTTYDYGFNIDTDDHQYISRPYSLLTEVWTGLITDRRES